jgi:hypothetical protein
LCSYASYLAGNFAPVKRALSLTPCSYEGSIPAEFHGGEYVRNGANPLTNDDLHRDSHWFDGDGMLTGVSFRRDDKAPGKVQPEFVNQFVHTDVYLSALTTPSLRAPILPSVATLVNPLSTIVRVVAAVLRTIVLVILSRLWLSKQAIKKISVANTSVLYHDGRALATCESGPPMRVMLPGLETVGWFNGQHVEGEADPAAWLTGFGGKGFFSFVREWTTAHVRLVPSRASHGMPSPGEPGRWLPWRPCANSVLTGNNFSLESTQSRQNLLPSTQASCPLMFAIRFCPARSTISKRHRWLQLLR